MPYSGMKAIINRSLWITTLWGLVCTVILVGCQSRTLQTKTPKVPSEVAFTAQYVRADGYVSGKDYPVVTKIVSVKELEAYIKANKGVYHIDRGDFQKAAAQYDNAFFRDQMLVLVLLEEPSGSIRHEVQSARVDGKNVAITIRRNVPQVGTDDMAEWYILIALDKTYSENTFSVEFK